MDNKTKTKTIILGGGIAGLLKAYFDPEAVLIAEQIGGQLSTPFQLGPRYIHVDRYVNQFFSKIRLYPAIRKVKVGFFYNNILHNTNTEENRKMYFEKTRGEGEPYKSSMSADMTEFDAFAIEPWVIANILKDKITNNVFSGKIESIDLNIREIIVNGETFMYEKLISTIPLDTFLYLNKKPEIAKLFKSYPTTFILERTADIQKGPNLYDYVYYSEPCYPFHRLTYMDDGIITEYKGDNIPTTKNEIDRYILKTGQLIENPLKINFQRVEFFGRYATWDHSILINTLLKQIYERNKI